MTSPALPDAPAEKEPWPPWAEGYLEALRRIPNVTKAAQTAGIARSTARRLGLRDPEFAEAVAEAREQSLDLLEEVIYARATSGLPMRKRVTRTFADGTVEVTDTEELHVSDTLAMFYLKRWRPEYREAYRVEQSGPDGGPIPVNVTGEEADAAVDGFAAAVVRLADARRARDGASGSATG